MLSVFVVDKHGAPLMPCHPARARELLDKGRAKVVNLQPFTIAIIDRVVSPSEETQPMECKVDPGSRTTGIALTLYGKKGIKLIFATNLEHRGLEIKDALTARRAIRRSRRNRHTRYRPARFDNRTRPAGWLPPSLVSRVDNVYHICKKFLNRAPLSALAIETVRFDTQKLQNPEISGTAYQQGELLGYEIREYLLEKWGRTCAYCGKGDRPLEVEHMSPKSKGGSDRISNLTLACKPCNQKKGNQPLESFVKDKKKLASLIAKAKTPLRDAAAVNATRYAIGNKLKTLGLPVTFWSGGRTKYNRYNQGYAKDHWIDAACVGETGEKVFIPKKISPLFIKAQGRGSRQKCRTDRYGFPRTGPKSAKRVMGFQTGDLVKAIVPQGKYKGTYVGRVAVRSTGNFNLKVGKTTLQGIHAKYCKLLQRCDGYFYGGCPQR